MAKKYLLGLDLGTDSVGWCVTDENDKIVRKGGKSLWGIRLFEEAQPAADRRAARAQRRRLQRRSERIDLLQSLFFDEMKKVDSTFFLRLNNAQYKPEDKDPLVRGDNGTLFIGNGLTDSKFYAQFPTIYHLRKYLLETKDKVDLRFVYLALHHMVKYRGNFLMENLSGDTGEAVASSINVLNESFSLLSIDQIKDVDTFANGLKRISLSGSSLNGTKDSLKTLFGSESKFVNNVVIPLLAGSNVDCKKIFGLEEDIDPKSVCTGSETFDADFSSLQGQMGDRPEISLIAATKKLRDFMVLWKLLGNEKTISGAMVNRYEKHKQDLRLLRSYVKQHLPDKYKEVFRTYNQNINNYVRYVGSTIVNGNRVRCEHCSQDEFYAYIKSLLGIDKEKDASTIADPYLKEVFSKISIRDYLPRQNSTDNGVFPYQLNLLEMKQILANQESYYPFLSVKDADGLTAEDKIESILTYRIPYYVGPLMTHSDTSNRCKFAWMVKKEDGKILPWNIEQKIDFDQSAQNFIKRMLNRCTYLRNEYCLPASSILYSKYNVYQYLNKIFVNGIYIKKEEKEELFNSVFLKHKTVTVKTLESFFKKKYGEDVNLSTSNDKPLEEVNASMGSYITFANIFGEPYVKDHLDMIESIITDLTIFEDSKTIENRLRKVYSLKDEKAISQIKVIRYSGWGRLSKAFLELKTPLLDKSTGEIKEYSIIDILKDTNENLMEILNDSRYQFSKQIADLNGEDTATFDNPKDKIEAMKSYIDDEYVSPGMKRPLIQSMEIIEEIQKIISHPIDEYYIEVTRSDQAKKSRTSSRKDRLLEIYADAKKNVIKEIQGTLEKQKALEEIGRFSDAVRLNKDINSFRSDKLYLYYLQLGKCAYTLKPISLEDLYDNSKYDIDHVVPQAKVKDDSLSNRVLVCCDANRYKKDIFPIPSNLLNPSAHAFYAKLHKMGFMDDRKYSNLTRTEPLSDEELNSFVNRQLVYTSQAVKAVADTIKAFEKNGKGEQPLVVYSKAENVSDFRKTYDVMKSRDANNFHHAHDAYLNIVVGRAIFTYFGGKNPESIKRRIMEMRQNGSSFNVDKVFVDYSKGDIHRSPLTDSEGGIVWDYQHSLAEIKKNIYKRFDVLSTTREYIQSGLLSKVSIHKASEDKGGNLFPLKSSGSSPLADTAKYGGYSDLTYGFYSLVEEVVKGKKRYAIEAMPNMFVDPKNVDSIKEYLTKRCGIEVAAVVVPCLRVNTVIEKGKSRFSITGKSGNSFLYKNINNPFFSYDEIKIIRNISKFLGILSKNKIKVDEADAQNKIIEQSLFAVTDDKIVVSEASNERTKELSITKKDLEILYESIEKKLNSPLIENISGAKIIGKNIADPLVKAKFDALPICSKIFVVSELLKAVGTTRELSNLLLVGLKKTSGCNVISKYALDGCRIVNQSITGFFTKVVWKCPSK